MGRQLIFDLGLHKGADAEYYISKGFNVIGVEANPELCKHVRDANKDALREGKLTVVERALATSSGHTVSFFINDSHDDWGSLSKDNCEQGVATAREIKVDSVTLHDLFKQYGEPYYIKCDLEGGDAIFAVQLAQSSYRPPFVSLEATSATDLAMLHASGYDRFQLINQWTHPFTRAPNPAREGVFVDAQFNSFCSGLFGLDLERKNWTDFARMMRMFFDWYDLHHRDPSLAPGWLDVHATSSMTLGL
jgi:FkbM family methyltransferase